MSKWSELLKQRAAELQAAPPEPPAEAVQAPAPEPETGLVRWVQLPGGGQAAAFGIDAQDLAEASRDVRFFNFTPETTSPMWWSYLKQTRKDRSC